MLQKPDRSVSALVHRADMSRPSEAAGEYGHRYVKTYMRDMGISQGMSQGCNQQYPSMQHHHHAANNKF